MNSRWLKCQLHILYLGMLFKQIGKSDLQVSAVCLGMMSYGSKSWRSWVLDSQRDCDLHVKKALELGINFFDTANTYSSGVSEMMASAALGKYAKREDYILATKVGLPVPNNTSRVGLSKAQIIENLEISLRNLGTEYIDLYQIHRWDYNTPIEETMEALHSLIKGGKIRYIGASSMYAWQLCKAQYIADLNSWTRFVSMQNHYNVVYREEEREMNAYCKEEDISLLPWSPIARGVVCGTRTRQGGTTPRSKHDPYGDKLYNRESDYKVADAVMDLGRQKGVSGAEVALAWLHQNPIVASPVFGATKISHIEEAAHSVFLPLTDSDIRSIEKPYEVNVVKPWNM